MSKIERVLMKALRDPVFKAQLAKNPEAAVRSSRIRMTKVEMTRLTSFMKQHDLATIRGTKAFKQMFASYETSNCVAGVRG